jgi:hypothetical protein
MEHESHVIFFFPAEDGILVSRIFIRAGISAMKSSTSLGETGNPTHRKERDQEAISWRSGYGLARIAGSVRLWVR